ncbi:MAG TPA: sulfite exporter TauE/SafE family protein [Candidatus Hydrogenedentes bacterium]|nr:sulfite exporter TauE/SafE family protein [Candidatus Hydrogenedentota bacterium]HPG68377.1 sulfite exporter TauE/SafE family protein [Candidatus Hydrogenedentota bacterium]
MFSEYIQPGVPIVIFWLFVGAAVVIQGISKSGFAGGAGILSLPLMMLVMSSPAKVAATLLPLLILCDMNAIYHHWHNKVWRTVLDIYIPSIAGIVLGAAVWWWIGREGIEQYAVAIKRFVGVVAVFFAVYIIGKEAAMDWVSRYRPGRKSAIGMGVVAGFTSTIAHAAGPFVSLYMFAQDLGKTMFVGTVAWTFTLINLTKLPFYVSVGLIQKDVLFFDLMLVWLIPIGSGLGKWMHTRVSESLFNRIVCVLTLVSGIQLVFNVPIIQKTLELVLGR